MQVQVDMNFEQLVEAVRKLPSDQLKRLKAVIENESKSQKPSSDFVKLLLNGPTATEEQIKVIEDNRKLLSKWR